MNESLSSEQIRGSLDRRAWIRKALTAGGVGYVAPMILGSATPATAQAVTGACANPDCDSTCGPGGSCACIDVVGGGTACVDPFCTFIACTTSADCAANEVCFTTGCCGSSPEVGFCVPLCGTGTPPGDGGSVPAGGGTSRWAH